MKLSSDFYKPILSVTHVTTYIHYLPHTIHTQNEIKHYTHKKIETLHSRRDEGIKWIILDRILCKKGRGVSKDLIGLIVKLLSFITLKYSIKFTEVDIYTWIAEDSTPMLRKFKCLKVNFTVYRTPLQVIRRRYCVIWAKGRR